MGIFHSAEDVRSVLFVYLALAFVPMITVFHHRALRARYGDLPGTLRYFAAFFAFFLAGPVLIVLAGAPRPGDILRLSGLTAGRAGTGLLLAAIGVPVAVIAGFIGSRDPALRAQYPFAKTACASLRRLVPYEIAYLLLYYIPWEFLFRGVLFLPLIPLIGLVPALALQAIAATLYHFGHPVSEIASAAASSFVFGLIASATGSVFYPAIIHAAVGIATDSFVCRRVRRSSAA
jgi:membrane protease YdiL (CAAX protease family)